MAEESDRVLGEIESRQYVWDRAEREAAAMRAISQSELVGWAKGALLKEGIKALSIHAYEGAVTKPAEQKQPPNAIAVTATDAFKAALNVHRHAHKPLPQVNPAAS